MWSPKLSWLTGIHYKHIRTIKNSRNEVEPLLKPPKTQLSLEVNLTYDIPLSHEARMISLFVDSIPCQVLPEETSHISRPAFHPAILMKMIVFTYARQVFSGRKIVQMSFP